MIVVMNRTGIDVKINQNKILEDGKMEKVDNLCYPYKMIEINSTIGNGVIHTPHEYEEIISKSKGRLIISEIPGNINHIFVLYDLNNIDSVDTRFMENDDNPFSTLYDENRVDEMLLKIIDRASVLARKIKDIELSIELGGTR